MNGRRPFYLIAILLSLVVAVKLGAAFVAWKARSWRGPTFGLSDLRDPKRLPPYAYRPPVPGPFPISTEVKGPFGTTHYPTMSKWAGSSDISGLEPVAIIEADATETVTLPGGVTIRLRALRFLPSDVSSRTLPVEEVYYDPSGRWMDRDEAMELNRLVNPEGDPGQVRNRNFRARSARQWSVGVVLETNLQETDFSSEGMFDSVTGGEVGPITGGYPVFAADLPNGTRLIRLRESAFDTVRPTPAVLWLHVKLGEPETVRLTSTAPQSFKLHGRECRLNAIGHFPGGKYANFAGRAANWQTGVPGEGREGEFTLKFEQLFQSVIGISAYDNDGNKLEQRSGALSNTFRGDPASLGYVEIRAKPDCAYVIFKLPQWPMVPEANRQTTDLMKMVLPPMTISNQEEWNALVARLLQVRMWGGGFMGIPPASALSFPMEVGGRTVGDLVAMEHSRFPPNEWVISKVVLDNVGHWPVGTTFLRKHPVLAWFVTNMNKLMAGLLLVAAVIGMAKGVRMGRAAALLRALRPRGYDMLTIWDAEVLVAGLGRLARKLPAHNDLATVPDVDIDDLDSIIAFMRRTRGQLRTGAES